MREAGSQAADSGEAVGMEQAPFQFDLAAMFFQQVRARLGQFLAELAEFADQEFDFIANRFRVVGVAGSSRIRRSKN